MSIGIVTAFFDIGRGTWDNPVLPSYLKRTNDEYFARFERLLNLDNDIVVYTENKFSDRFDSYRQQKENLTVVYVNDWTLIWEAYRLPIIDAMKRQQKTLKIQQAWNPEYWSVDYVMINYLKSWFVENATTFGHLRTDMIAWLDFGYPREPWQVPTNRWEYDFDPEKIHFFTTKPIVPTSLDIRNLIETNDVFIMGCHIVASKQKWAYLKWQIRNNIDLLLQNRLVDDDQTILYMCYVNDPEMYEVHHIDVTQGDWFQILMRFNNAV